MVLPGYGQGMGVFERKGREKSHGFSSRSPVLKNTLSGERRQLGKSLKGRCRLVWTFFGPCQHAKNEKAGAKKQLRPLFDPY